MNYDQIVAMLEAQAAKTGAFKPLATAGISILKENKEIFKNASEDILIQFLNLIAAKKHDAAKEFFIKNFAKASDLIDGMKKGTDAIRTAPADLETVFDAIWLKLTTGFASLMLNIALKAMTK